MGDSEILAVGVFISLWLVAFFGYSAYELRRGYAANNPRLEKASATSHEALTAGTLPKY